MSISKKSDDNDRFYKTLGRDIEIQRRNEDGRWDRTLDKGDFKQVKGKDCVQNDITIALLTAYNELGSKGLTTYTNFGNHSYELLKENKSNMVLYKLESYFKKVIKNIRRVRDVTELNILEYTPYSFDLNFTVETLMDENITGEISYNAQRVLSRTFLSLNVNPSNKIDVGVNAKLTSKITNIRGSGLPNLDVIFFVNGKKLGQTSTDENGVATMYYSPTETEKVTIRTAFNGSNYFHTSESESLNLNSFQYNFFQDSEGNLFLIYNENTEVTPQFLVEGNGDFYVDTDTISNDLSLDNDGNLYVEL
jgi:hypothetical protein